jgi:small subunit ribosomal protein S16
LRLSRGRARPEQPPGHRSLAHLAEYERNHRLREALSNSSPPYQGWKARPVPTPSARHPHRIRWEKTTAVAVKIKLKRMGKIREPYYRIVVADARTKRDGRAIEEIGKYHPKADPSLIEVDSARAQHWLSVGAQPTDPVRKLLEVTGDWQRFKGLPGAEGTLRAAAPRTDKKQAFAAALAEALAESGAAAPKGKGRAGGSRTSEAKAGDSKAGAGKAGAGKAGAGKAGAGKAEKATEKARADKTERATERARAADKAEKADKGDGKAEKGAAKAEKADKGAAKAEKPARARAESGTGRAARSAGAGTAEADRADASAGVSVSEEPASDAAAPDGQSGSEASESDGSGKADSAAAEPGGGD